MVRSFRLCMLCQDMTHSPSVNALVGLRQGLFCALCLTILAHSHKKNDLTSVWADDSLLDAKVECIHTVYTGLHNNYNMH